MLNINRISVIGLSLLCFFCAAPAFAAPLYTPGETLDPNCSPSDADCTVGYPINFLSDVDTATVAPVTNDILIFNGTVWAPTSTAAVSNSLFTDSGATTYLTQTSDSLAVGTTTATQKITVDGNLDLQNNGAIYINNKKWFAADTGTISSYIGQDAGLSSIGSHNNLLGYQAGQNNTGSDNNILGQSAGSSNSGSSNNIFGQFAGSGNTGSDNNILGLNAGSSNSGYDNNLLGLNAGSSNSGSYNNIFGHNAGSSNVNSDNNLFGQFAGYSNSGSSNNILGPAAGYNNAGSNNNFLGSYAGYNNTGVNNNFFGQNAGYSNTGDYNNFLGHEAGKNSTSTSNNNIFGYQAGLSNAGSDSNIFGKNAGTNNTGAAVNLFGSGAGHNNTGSFNNFIGFAAGYNATGTFSNIFGFDAGYNSSGYANNILGHNAGHSNSGSQNQILGLSAGYFNTGSGNNISGYFAGYSNTGSYNNMFGHETGRNLQATSSDIIGSEAFRGGSGFSSYQAVNNVALGYRTGFNAQTGANNNILLGYQAADNLTTGANNIVLGYDVDLPNAAGNNQLVIGNLIYGTGIDGAGTTISSGNIGIGTTTPSRRLTVVTGDSIAGYFSGRVQGANAVNNDEFVTLSQLSASSSLFTDGGTTTYLTQTADSLAIGTTTATQKLTVNGNLDLQKNGAIYVNGTKWFAADVENNSTFIGEGAGVGSSGEYNTSIGIFAGISNTGFNNNLIGYNAGRSNTGSNNNIIGFNAGRSNGGNNNNIIGRQAGQTNVGDNNNFIGFNTGAFLTGNNSTIIGAESFQGNTFFSTFAADNNVALGYRTGYNAKTGASNNILLGYQAADNLTTGANNIVLGYDVDLPSASGSNQLVIGNLIYGTGIDGAGTTVSTGNIGIGTNAPNDKLDVAGRVHISDANTHLKLTETDFSDKTWHMELANGNFRLTESGVAIPATFEAGAGNNALYIKSGGNVGISTAVPSTRLHVRDDSISTGGILTLADADSTCIFTADAGSGPTCGSDRTLKKDITNIENELDLITKLEPKFWRFKSEHSNDPLKSGFIAQEVEDVLPELVSENTWIDGTEKKFLNISGMIPYIVGAIKELYEMVTGIDERVTENEEEIESLRAELCEKDSSYEWCGGGGDTQQKNGGEDTTKTDSSGNTDSTSGAGGTTDNPGGNGTQKNTNASSSVTTTPKTPTNSTTTTQDSDDTANTGDGAGAGEVKDEDGDKNTSGDISDAPAPAADKDKTSDSGAPTPQDKNDTDKAISPATTTSTN